MIMASCPFCGATDAGSGSFCQHCGKPVRATIPAYRQRVAHRETYARRADNTHALRIVIAILAALIVTGGLVGAYFGGIRIYRRQQPVAKQEVKKAVEQPQVELTKTMTAAEIAQRAFPTVVMLVVEDEDGRPLGLGSGFFVCNDVIATNHHVIKNAAQVYAKLVDQEKKYTIEGIVADDSKNDLALLKVDTVNMLNARQANSEKPLVIGEIEKVAVGDTVYAVGNPKGLEGTFSQGIVSGFREYKEKHLIQITAPISPGSSGGPVLNDKGEVIGVAVGTLVEGQNLNFAIPVSYLGGLLNRMKPVSSFAANREYASYESTDNDPPDESAASTDEDSSIPQVARMHYKQGIAYENQNRHAQAIESFSSAIRNCPDYLAAYIKLGSCYDELKLYDEAVRAFKKAISIRPDVSAAHIYLGFTYAKMEEYDEAIRSCKEAIRITPDNAMAHYLLGTIYVVIENKESALAEYRVLKNLNPNMAKELFNQIYK